MILEALTGFLDRAQKDSRLDPFHISLYVVLLEMSEGKGSSGFFAIYSSEVMSRAKIVGKTTYYKRIRELADWGYIVYRPNGGEDGSLVRV